MPQYSKTSRAHHDGGRSEPPLGTFTTTRLRRNLKTRRGEYPRNDLINGERVGKLRVRRFGMFHCFYVEMLMSNFWLLLQFLDAGKTAKRAILSNVIVDLIMRARSRGIGAGKRALVWYDSSYFCWCAHIIGGCDGDGGCSGGRRRQ